MNLRTEVTEPEAEPSTLKASVAGDECGFTTVKLAEHSLPDFPRRVVCDPERLELLLFALGVHTLPKTGVTMGLKLAFMGKVRQRFALQNAIISSEVFANTPVEHEEAAIHKGDDDFGARPAKAPLFIRRTQRHTRRDNGDQHTAHGRKGMERVGDDRD